MKQKIEIINDLVEKAIFDFFRHEFFGWIEIDLNYATISIEKLMPTCADRGKYKILATHKFEHFDKCYIDYEDAFPRYYFSFECMIRELKSWIKARPQLEIDEITMCCHEKRETIKEYIKKEK